GERLLSLVNDLLDLSKLEAGRVVLDMKTNNLLTIIEDVISEFKIISKENKIGIKVNLKTANTDFYFDHKKIEQVIRNLISNAIKFTPPNGIITITIDNHNMITGKSPRSTPSRDAIMCSISDTGVGIPEDELESIFDKFIQSSKTNAGSGGTGLGLAICDHIIRAHSGTIKAENNPDRGACFSFSLWK
ncbi:MAG: HAMP domain-containing histidine kinase, partial [Gammaproteobacteria bacterium]|nr:HAMP domain-containing histidine kinase [Gammaproteobacteria bacterium]